MAGAEAADIQSSWGKREMNPVLAGPNGAFGARGALIKAAVTGGALLFEYLEYRRRPSGKLLRWLGLINFGTAGTIGGVAARNYGVPAPAQ